MEHVMTQPAADRALARIQSASIPGDLAHDGIIQATVEDPFDRVTLRDRTFRVAEEIGFMPLLKFSNAAEINLGDPRAMSAMYAVLRDCIYPGTPACGECEICVPPPCGKCEGCAAPTPEGEEPRCYLEGAEVDTTRCKAYDAGDWPAFEQHAIDTRAGADELFDVINETFEVISGRPTQPPGRSSGGQRRTSGASTGTSSKRRAKGSRR
jgi:hypothetical protein